MSMTKQEAIENHRKLWNWIAEQSEKRQKKVEKVDYFKSAGIGESTEFGHDSFIENDCYCCEYCKQQDSNFDSTNCKCPLQWEKNNNYNSLSICINSYYGSWHELRTLQWKESVRIARIIANLPESEVEA